MIYPILCVLAKIWVLIDIKGHFSTLLLDDKPTSFKPSLESQIVSSSLINFIASKVVHCFKMSQPVSNPVKPQAGLLLANK